MCFIVIIFFVCNYFCHPLHSSLHLLLGYICPTMVALLSRTWCKMRFCHIWFAWVFQYFFTIRDINKKNVNEWNILRSKIINTLSGAQFDFHASLKSKLLFFFQFYIRLTLSFLPKICRIEVNFKLRLKYWIWQSRLEFHEIASLLIYLGGLAKKKNK
jgi:hypothetical protein